MSGTAVVQELMDGRKIQRNITLLRHRMIVISRSASVKIASQELCGFRCCRSNSFNPHWRKLSGIERFGEGHESEIGLHLSRWVRRRDSGLAKVDPHAFALVFRLPTCNKYEF